MAKSFFHNNTIEDIFTEMTMVYLNDKRPWIIGYSGGKDSTLVVQLVYDMLLRLPEDKRHKPVYVISSDTLIENPIIAKYLKYNIDLINSSAKRDHLPIEAHIVYPRIDDTFWVNIIGRGYPPPKSIMYRWCTERLKIKPSNDFIKSKLEDQDVVVLLGVRKEESTARRIRIENKEIDGYLLVPHESLRNERNMAYVYNPIVDLTTDDVWTLLLQQDVDNMTWRKENREKDKSPWGGDNNFLFSLYSMGSGDDGECPFITDDNKARTTCGNSRFGCWVCTVVAEDKSLKGFIESGETWLRPLKEFRDWLKSDDFRNNPKYRKKHKRSGAVTRTKSGDIMFGPFTFEARQIILERLLRLQMEMQKVYPGLELISVEELKIIDEIWDDEEDLTRTTLVNLYYRVTGRKLPWHDYKNPLFDERALRLINEKCKENDISMELMASLLIQTDKYKYFSNTTKLRNRIGKLLDQQWLHNEIMEEIENGIKNIEEKVYENK